MDSLDIRNNYYCGYEYYDCDYESDCMNKLDDNLLDDNLLDDNLLGGNLLDGNLLGNLLGNLKRVLTNRILQGRIY